MLLKTAILFTVSLSGYLCQDNSISTETWIYCAECVKQDITLVCGFNGKTYINACFVGCLNSELSKKGETEIEIATYTICHSDVLAGRYHPVNDPGSIEDCAACEVSVPYPVCGSDGTTYENACIFECTAKVQKGQGIDLEKNYNGVCLTGSESEDRYVPPTEIKKNLGQDVWICARKFHEPYHCPECHDENPNWDPYCGSDGQTYGNDCYLKCAIRLENEQGNPGPRISYSGSCDPAWNSYFTFFKNAAEKFQGLDRSCSMGDITAVRVEGSTIEMADNTPCNDCGTFWRPVCGSDSLSYMNLCALDCVSNVKSGLTKAHEGSCNPALDNYLDYFWYVSQTLSGTYKPLNINFTIIDGY